MELAHIKFRCPKCDVEYSNIVSLSKHWSRTHKEKTSSLYLSLKGLDRPPSCKCGCGQETAFLDTGRGYRDFIRGHQSRVKNNFVSEKAQQNSAKTRRKMVEEGTWKPFHLNETGEHWSKGLTKETDERIAKMSRSIVEGPEKEKRSKRMKEGRLNGTVPTLSGKDHSQWKGGASSLNHVCRANGNLYRKWIKPKMILASFSCEVCGCSGGRLEVHHNKETFSEILRKISQKHDWGMKLTTALEPENEEMFTLKQKISNEVARYHIDNNISGIVLCKACHKKEHNKHNF